MFNGGSDLTSRFVNALRGAAAQNQRPNRSQMALFPQLFGDIGETVLLHLIIGS